MHITLVDDSIPFDGYTPTSFPLGGAEKAFASLPGALAERGHKVVVFNRCKHPLTIKGARWHRWEETRPLETDALIAFRRAPLLLSVRKAKRRVLWLTAPASTLETPEVQSLFKDLEPSLLFNGTLHRQGYTGSRPAAVVPLGLRSQYLTPAPRLTPDFPVAIATTHPAHGLDWLVDLWLREIHPQVSTARLHLYSAILSRPRGGQEVPERFRPLAAKIEAAKAQGIHVMEPLGDEGMAIAYHSARVHLHPGQREDMLCWTVAESQACGVPAVVRPLGAAPERLVNGQTGFVVPDEAAFANVAVQILSDAAVFKSLSDAAVEAWQGRTWAMAAEAVEKALTA